MSTPRSDWPSTPDFHPEFGLLFPSPRGRRSIRLVLVSVMVGMAIGAAMELSVAHWGDSDAAPSPEARAIDQESLAEGPAVQVVLDIPVVSTRPSKSNADELTFTRPQGFCKDTGAKGLAMAFLNPTCGSPKSHARHSERTTSRVATVIVGRTELPPAPAEPMQVNVAAIETSHAAVGAAGKAVIPTTQPVERPAPPKKPRAAPIALTPPNREPTQQDVGSMAFAAVPRGSGYFDRPGDIFRAATLPSSGGPFGGIW
jgi:hypothetical protein